MKEPLHTSQHAVKSLLKMRARLMGELLKIDREIGICEKRIGSWRNDRAMRETQIGDIDRSIALFDPSVDPTKVKPVKKVPRVGMLAHGDLRREILAVLKEAVEPLTARKIHDAIIRRNGLVFPDDEACRKHRQKLRDALHDMAGRNPPLVEATVALSRSCQGGEQLWRLSAFLRDE